MKTLTLFLGDSDTDVLVQQILERWRVSSPNVVLEYKSIHADPIAVVRLGITEIPALVLEEEVIAQGSPESWVLSLLNRIFSQHHLDGAAG